MNHYRCDQYTGGVPVPMEMPATITDDIIRLYWALVREQTIDMWLRGDIRWPSMRGALS